MRNRPEAKPFLKWAGGKTSSLPILLENLAPNIKTYYEPFVGAGALFFKLRHKFGSVINDVNWELINVYRQVQNNPTPLADLVDEHAWNHCSDYYYEIRNLDRKAKEYAQLPDLQKAARFLYLNRTCYNGLYRVNKRGQNNVPIGKRKYLGIVNRLNLSRCQDALSNAIILNGSYLQIEPKLIKRDFVYLDPPYVPIFKEYTSQYTADNFGSKEQEELRDFCLRINEKGVRFLLSNSDTPLVHELYAPHFAIGVTQVKRPISCNSSDRGYVNELFIKNY